MARTDMKCAKTQSSGALCLNTPCGASLCLSENVAHMSTREGKKVLMIKRDVRCRETVLNVIAAAGCVRCIWPMLNGPRGMTPDPHECTALLPGKKGTK